MEKLNKKDMLIILEIARQAGNAIIKVYNSNNFDIEYKKDKSPLTIADKNSNEIILTNLRKFYPEITILSEEEKDIPYDKRKNWRYFWLIDPLDGTKDFIKRNGEFTVNIALVHKNKPVFGVVYAPVLDIIYYAIEGKGSFKQEKKMNFQKLPIEIDDRFAVNNNKITVVASRSHMSDETNEYINRIKEKYSNVEVTSIGSSLKLCMVAEGKADVYPRFGPTMEWDTAASQVIVEQSGGRVINAETNTTLKYNKKNLLNPWFIVESRRFMDTKIK